MSPEMQVALIGLGSGLTLVAAMTVMVTLHKREERLARIEAELRALRTTMPASTSNAIDNIVAAFALGAAFASTVTGPAAGNDTDAKSKPERSSDSNDLQGVTATAVTTATG